MVLDRVTRRLRSEVRLRVLLLSFRLPRFPHRPRHLDRHVPLLQIDLADDDASFELPRVLRAVDADVVDAGAGDEADGAAAVVEGAAVAGVDGGVDAVAGGDQGEGGDDEAG